ncbi:MAG TPA: L-histidine N(alpha)-methyltransferase [Acidimicrobiales bacterium]|nr:L-histidine N(alpha)-methyltransferase [Acidimicrobiales bacterium]
MEITVRLGPDDLVKKMREDVRAGLTRTPKDLPAIYLYDDRGSELFDEITRLAEYYPTRAERSILEAHSSAIALTAHADILAELGSGTSEKTRILLRAMTGGGLLTRYVPFDVSEETLRSAASAIVAEFPRVNVHGIVGDFRADLDAIPAGTRRMIAFLGGTIGNFTSEDRAAFLADVVEVMHPGDSLLLGTDLVKDRDRLIAAYDDAAGVTASFNRNLLTMLNRELGADFDVEQFEHVARWDDSNAWIEMRLRARSDQRVHLRDLDLDIEFAAGEEMRTEISAKFTESRVREELERAGLSMRGWWTDSAGDYALSLAKR